MHVNRSIVSDVCVSDVWTFPKEKEMKKQYSTPTLSNLGGMQSMTQGLIFDGSGPIRL